MKRKLLKIVFYFIVIVIFVFLFFLVISKKKTKENISSKPYRNFVINKIHYYSSANALSNTTNYQNPEWNLKIYQYTDIALYLERMNEVSLENYITKIFISNFHLNSEKQKVYYLNPNMFGNGLLNEDNIINDILEFNIINSSNDNNQNYNIPVYFQDCSNPITLRVINNLADNYKISSQDALTYNGGLIKLLGIGLDKLENQISFDLNIETKSGDNIKRTIEIEIPFSDDEQNILDGDFEIEKDENIVF